MYDTILFRKIRFGKFFFYAGHGLCIKTHNDVLFDENQHILHRCDALVLKDRTPILIDVDETVVAVDIVNIGDHLWFPAYTAGNGGMGPFEIKMVHDRELNLDFIPVCFGIRFSTNRATVTGLVRDAWTFVSYEGLVPFQRNFKVISTKA